MKWVLLLLLASMLATQVWLCIRVARSSGALAALTFFVGAPGALYTLIQHRDDPETSVTRPFVANVVSLALLAGVIVVFVLPALELQEREYARAHGLPLASPAAAPASLPEPAGASEALTAADAMTAFSQALDQDGLRHVVTRLPESVRLPAGVLEAAQYAVAPLESAVAANDVAAPTTAGYSVTLYRCDNATTCRNLAGAQMQQGDERRRVLQNGLLLLSTPLVAANETDLTPAAVARAFRRLDF